MSRRTIAALILSLAAPALATEFHSPAYDQAADMASGRVSAGSAYDGSAAQAALNAQVAGALKTGGLEVAAPPASAPSLKPAALPASPDLAPKSEPLVTRRSLTYGGAGAAAGAAAGWLLGGPIGALIGAAAGFALGFLLSKLLG